MASCRWLSDLQLALATLYSLPSTQNLQSSNSSASPLQQNEAHEFLMRLTTTNTRRKVKSLQQRYKDQLGKQQQVSTVTIETVQMGSISLPCLILLGQVHIVDGGNLDFSASTTERLFCAQTLLHRLRRVKIEEAIDLEFESPHDIKDVNTIMQLYNNVDYMATIVPSYKQMMQNMNPLVAAVLNTYHADVTTPEQEARVKAELVLLTISSVAYLVAATANAQTEHAMPLLDALGHCLAVIVLRLRYNPLTESESLPSLVQLLAHSLEAVQQGLKTIGIEPDANALCVVWQVVLGALPDALLGSPGGTRGRLSMDPECIRKASSELRSFLVNMWQILAMFPSPAASAEMTLKTLERWAKFLPLTEEFLVQVLPLLRESAASSETPIVQAAFQYILIIFESGSWTSDQVLGTMMGMTDDMKAQQQGKKRQTSRSKKRQKAALDKRATDTCTDQAEKEILLRGRIACQTAVQLWDILEASVIRTLDESDNTSVQVHGEGPIGCVTACANTCLPFILTQSGNNAEAMELQTRISVVFRRLCHSRNKSIRGLTLEPLYTLHASLLSLLRNENGQSFYPEMENLLVDHFHNCAMGLANHCGYPNDYFGNLAESSDQELEIERNDARDMIRAVACSEEGGSTSSQDLSRKPLPTTVAILRKLLDSCGEAIMTARSKNQFPPETALHSLSALAKPLNYLSRSNDSTVASEICLYAVQCLVAAHESVLSGIDHPMAVYSLCRTLHIAVASLAPMFAAMISIHASRPELISCVENLLDIAVRCGVWSLSHLPELFAPSQLDREQYDIRGTMRGPGGEDHVACLTFMRLCEESDQLGRLMIRPGTQHMHQLCKLHTDLKSIEERRGLGILHGIGVTTTTRRILLRAVCRLEVVSGGKGGASQELTDLFNSTLSTIANLNAVSQLDESYFARLCECTFDLAAFSSTVVVALFRNEEPFKTQCLTVISSALQSGYAMLSDGPVNPTIVQWNRFRASLFALIKATGSADVPQEAVSLVSSWIVMECEAIRRQCTTFPRQQSSLFNEDVISPEKVPAGLFVNAVFSILCDSYNSQESQFMTNCMQIAVNVKDTVFECMLLPCPDPEIFGEPFIDPRCTLAEAWFAGLGRLLQCEAYAKNTQTVNLAAETCVVASMLPFYKTIARTAQDRATDPGMSLDGPQVLAMIEFLASCYRLGLPVLLSIGTTLFSKLDIDLRSVEGLDSEIVGMSTLIASLYRGVQGSFPPWTVEAVPELFSSLFIGFGQDCDLYGKMLNTAMLLRVGSRFQTGRVNPGELLSGHCFESLANKAREDFILEAVQIAHTNDMTGWRRMKTITKSVCGGKKKDSDFKQRPAYTKWEFDRL